MIRFKQIYGDDNAAKIYLVTLTIATLRQVFELSLPSAVRTFQITEWLISYDGGFVRRGLWGEIIFGISNILKLSPSVVTVGLSTLTYVCAVIFAIRWLSQNLPRYLLLSPLLLGMPVYSNFMVRKDVLVIVLFVISAFALRFKDWRTRFFALNGTAILAMLTHESFLFFAIPFLILNAHRSLLNHSRDNIRARIANGLLFMSPTLLVATFVFSAKGSPDVAVAISNHWDSFLKDNFPSYCCFNGPTSAIETIGWSTRKYISFSSSILNDFAAGIIYVPAAWLVTICLASYIVLATWTASPKSSEARSFNSLDVFIFQIIFILPLFVVGFDWGRFIFMYMASSVAILKLSERGDIYVPKLWKLGKIGESVYRPNYLPIVLFFFAVPPCCWERAFFSHTPIGSYVILIKQAVQYWRIGWN
jgi:hypothetical protein